MKREHFGTTADGQAVDIITLDSGKARCRIITYGAAIVSLEIPDKNGTLLDVVLGYDSLEAYMAQNKFMGAVVGRYANRIGGSRFSLGGVEYILTANEGENHLHGGTHGFDKRVWAAQELPKGVRLTLTSPHLDEGYPGKLEVAVDYILIDTTLEIIYYAISDRDTICNLTNHAYFNLDGHDAGSILDHELTLNSDFYTPVSGKSSIPTGEIASVADTPMDFRTPQRIGTRIDSDFPQLQYGTGYDHNWVVREEAGFLRPAALLHSKNSGISMYVDTDMPGIQFYAGNFLDGNPAGKSGAVYQQRGGLCLETQLYPDSPNRPEFPSPVLLAGKVWSSRTIFNFCINLENATC